MEGCRPARPDDLDRIVQLAGALRAEIEPLRGASVWQGKEGRAGPLTDAYASLLDHDDVRVVVGTIDDTPLGFGVAELVTLHDGRLLGVVSDLYVEPEARAVGIGEAMVDHLLSWCADHGCVGVDGWALPGHRMTKNFFEQHGFVARLIVVHRPLDDEAPAP